MIIIISSVFPPEPIVSASIGYDLATELSKIHEVKVLTPKPTRPFGFSFEHESRNEIRKFEQIILNSFTYPKSRLLGRMRESYSFGKHVKRYIKKHHTEIECVYIHAWPLLSQYIIVKMVKKYSIPSVIHVQDIYPESLTNKIPVFRNLIQKLLLPMDIFALKTVSKVIAVSENMKINFIQIRGVSPEKITIIPNWQDEDEFIKYYNLKTNFHRNNEVENKLFTFMYLGNIGPVAGLDFVIRSFALADLKDARLVIAGSGSRKEECLELASDYKNTNIHFWDVPPGKVPETQDKADVMLLPIKRGAAMSSIPSKLTAYLLSRKPIIACVEENSDTARVIKDANCGWVVPPEDFDKLMKFFQTIISFPKNDLIKYGANGFNYAEENFSNHRHHGRQGADTHQQLPG